MGKRVGIFSGFFFAFFAQQATADRAVTGTVADADNTPVAGAYITFTYAADTQQTFDAMTASDGGYEVLLLPILPDVPTGVGEIQGPGIPETSQLFHNYPNPFNPNTVIPYHLAEPGYVELSIYNALGHKIRTLVDRYQEAGAYSVEWDGRNALGVGVSGGVYFYRLKAGGYERASKMVMIDGAATKGEVFNGSRLHKPVTLAQEKQDRYNVRITGEDIENFRATDVAIPEDNKLDFTVSRLPKDCEGTGRGSALVDGCGICDADPSTDCSFTYSPANNAFSVPWDPEIGIRIRLNDPSLSLSEARISNIANALTVTDMNGANVEGETKLFPLEQERELLVSFVPAKVLYGHYTYQVTIDAEAVLDVGGALVNFSQAVDSSGLLESGTYSWTFTTSELTRFTLPVLLEYDDTVCHCSGSPDTPKPPGCLASSAPSQFDGQCYTSEHVDEIVFGPENNQISGYWSHMSQGRLVLSKLRRKEGQILGTVHLRRTGVKGEGQTTNRDFRNSESEAILAELSEFIDFDRYALIKTPQGDLNVLSPYPDRDFVASRVENGYYEHFNVYLMQIYGNPENFTFGSSGSPSSSWTDINTSLSHQDYYYSSYKWLHETGHGFFGMKDLYYQSQFPGTGGVFGIMGNHYAHDIPPQTSDAWHTIIAEIALTKNPYDATDVTDILADGKADASCGTADSPCYLRARYPDGEIWRFPAVIENGEVVGEYYVEFYGTQGNDGNLEFQGVDHNQHPGVISVWKMDESTQKILDHICYFEGCDVERYHERSSHWERPEYYPSCPNVMPTEWLARTPIYKTFPWWEYERMPYISADLNDQPAAAMPRTIELPVVEVPAYGGTGACAAPVMDPTCRFGGGNKIGAITLGFDETVNALEAQISSDPLDRNAYLLPAEIPFTLTFEPTTDTPMTYADHILPQHLKYISTDTDDYCGQILTDGFLMPETD